MAPDSAAPRACVVYSMLTLTEVLHAICAGIAIVVLHPWLSYSALQLCLTTALVQH